MQKKIDLIGVPMDAGKRRSGCLMGPDAFRTAGIVEALADLGHEVRDQGNLQADSVSGAHCANAAVHSLDEVIGWTTAIQTASADLPSDHVPVYMGGDHALSLGSVTAMATRAASAGKPLFVLWLDAHADFNTPLTTASGNLHGTPFAYATGQAGFDAFPAVAHPVPLSQTCLIGLRSVDRPEREMLQQSDAAYVDMRRIDEVGIAAPLATFLKQVKEAGGQLHVSLDVDFLEPAIAPAVGTTVPGGATEREGHLVMEMLCDSGLMTSLDLVELNPFLDERGRTARLMVDLAASLFGRRIFDRPTQAFG